LRARTARLIGMAHMAASPIPQPTMDCLFIGISGLIGAGKSTLARELAKVMNLPVYYEPVIDNEYLADFYKDMKRYAFSMQIYLLNRRFKQQQQIVWSGKGGVQDRTIYEDSVFARMLRDGGFMEERDYKTYLQLFSNMSHFMQKPNIIVHLDVSPEESLRRIRMRERDCESSITLDYLRALHAAYEDFLRDISRVIPIIKVNYSEFRTAAEMAERIREEYLRIHNIRHVDFKTRASRSLPASPESAHISPEGSDGETDAASAKESKQAAASEAVAAVAAGEGGSDRA